MSKKGISCFTCLYCTIGSDDSGASPDYLEECKSYACQDAIHLLLDAVFDYGKTISIHGKVFYDNMEMEDTLPRLCGCWVEDPRIAYMEAEIKKMEATDNA